MDFEDKLAAAKKLLAKKGLSKRTYDPGIFVLLRKAGLELPPPQFLHFSLNFLIMTALGFIIMIVWWLLGLPGIGTEIKQLGTTLVTSLMGGMFIGLIMAAIYFYGSYKYSVPKWNEFLPADEQMDK